MRDIKTDALLRKGSKNYVISYILGIEFYDPNPWWHVYWGRWGSAPPKIFRKSSFSFTKQYIPFQKHNKGQQSSVSSH